MKMLDAATVDKRAVTIRRMLARYREMLEQSRAGLETSAERLGDVLDEEDELHKTAILLIEGYETEIKQVTEAISWMEDTNVEEGKGKEAGIGLGFFGVKCNKWR